MAELPELHGAVTKSYRFRHRFHLTQELVGGDTLCGRTVDKSGPQTYDRGLFEAVDGHCLRCLQSVKVMERTHEGFLN